MHHQEFLFVCSFVCSYYFNQNLAKSRNNYSMFKYLQGVLYNTHFKKNAEINGENTIEGGGTVV